MQPRPVPGCCLSGTNRCNRFAGSGSRAGYTKKPEAAPPTDARNPRPQIEEDQDVPKGQTSISVSVDLVSLQVLVTDTKGNVITGLKPENFTIYEDNVKQEISNFSPIDANITVVMLVEYSNNISYFIDDVWNAMYYFRQQPSQRGLGRRHRLRHAPDHSVRFHPGPAANSRNALRRFTYPGLSMKAIFPMRSSTRWTGPRKSRAKWPFF